MRQIRFVFLAVLLVLVAAAVAYAESAKPIPGPVVVMERGAMVLAVRAGSPAEDATLAVGDIIVSVNGIPVTSEEQMNRVLRLNVIVRLEVVRRDDARKVRLLAFPRKGELGIRVVMVDPGKAPLLFLDRIWV